MCQNNPCSEQQIRALNPDISNKFHKIKHCGLVPAQRMSQSQDKNSPRSKEAITMVNATKKQNKTNKKYTARNKASKTRSLDFALKGPLLLWTKTIATESSSQTPTAGGIHRR